MARFQAKQIKKYIAAPIRVNNLTVVGSTFNITSSITSILTTAGFNGGSVTLSPSSSELTTGVIVSGTNNRVEIYKSSTKLKMEGPGGEIYGRITYDSSVYTLSFYTLVSGLETSYNLPSNAIDFEFNYRYEFKDLPTDALIGIVTRNVNQDLPSSGTLVTESLTVSGINLVSDLSSAPDTSSNIALIVNGQEFNNLTASSAFSVVGTAVTWIPLNAGFDLEITDKVIARYTT
jgi:hypothetical protein